MGKVTNTETQRRHPEWLGGQAPQKIEEQERQGQAELCAPGPQVLPTEGLEEVAGKLKAITVGAVVTDDPLFTEVDLPEGWELKPVEGTAFWSVLVDQDGVERAGVFYKASFHDRKAKIVLPHDEPLETEGSQVHVPESPVAGAAEVHVPAEGDGVVADEREGGYEAASEFQPREGVEATATHEPGLAPHEPLAESKGVGQGPERE